jgi:quinoprotein dehydrogenase-associated probable ABC transporter substrate-binding protein
MYSPSSDMRLLSWLASSLVMLAGCSGPHQAQRTLPGDSVVSATIDSARMPANAVASTSTLRVCSDPNNLPFSNARGEGFENRIAQLVAKDLHEKLEYVWWAQRRGYLRNTITADKCDVWIGVPSGLGPLLTTQPYYRSTYVFLTRANDPIRVKSFDDSVLRHVLVGVQLVGDDGANTPPAHALSRRHIIQNVRGFHLEADYRNPNPPARIVDALARHQIDVAVVWGPMGGYFATREPVKLRVTPVAPQVDLPFLPFVFDIAMGVRRSDSLLARRLDSVIVRRQSDINTILASYGVPRADAPLVQ